MAIDARPIDEPEGIGFNVPPRRRIVVAHPVLVKAAFGLEPLAGEAQVDRGATRRQHPAAGQVGRRPDYRTRPIHREKTNGRWCRCFYALSSKDLLPARDQMHYHDQPKELHPSDQAGQSLAQKKKKK